MKSYRTHLSQSNLMNDRSTNGAKQFIFQAKQQIFRLEYYLGRKLAIDLFCLCQNPVAVVTSGEAVTFWNWKYSLHQPFLYPLGNITNLSLLIFSFIPDGFSTPNFLFFLFSLDKWCSSKYPGGSHV